LYLLVGDFGHLADLYKIKTSCVICSECFLEVVSVLYLIHGLTDLLQDFLWNHEKPVFSRERKKIQV
jgi:hypothetical protein